MTGFYKNKLLFLLLYKNITYQSIKQSLPDPHSDLTSLCSWYFSYNVISPMAIWVTLKCGPLFGRAIIRRVATSIWWQSGHCGSHSIVKWFRSSSNRPQSMYSEAPVYKEQQILQIETKQKSHNFLLLSFIKVICRVTG